MNLDLLPNFILVILSRPYIYKKNIYIICKKIDFMTQADFFILEKLPFSTCYRVLIFLK